VNLDSHFAAHFTSVQKLDVPWSDMQRVTLPVLTIHGTKDRNAPNGSGREWPSKLPNARLLTIEGVAHKSWVDAPEVIFSAVRELLKGDGAPEAKAIGSVDK